MVGDYYFRNTTDDSVSLAISYPFPVDLRHARPFRVGAWLVNDQERRPLGFHNVSDAITWRMAFEPRAEKHVQVEYVQRIAGKHAVYIVTTTSLWGEPIEVAEFEFRVPASLGGHRLSFEPDRAETRGDTVVYSMKRTDFMPDSDLEIWW